MFKRSFGWKGLFHFCPSMIILTGMISENQFASAVSNSLKGEGIYNGQSTVKYLVVMLFPER